MENKIYQTESVINKNSRSIKKVFLERFDNAQLEKHCPFLISGLFLFFVIKYSFNIII